MPRPHTFDLAEHVRARRGEQSLTDCAAAIGIDRNLLFRIESGGYNTKTLDFLRIVAWLGVIDGPTYRKLLAYAGNDDSILLEGDSMTSSHPKKRKEPR